MAQMETKKILILEDNLYALSALMKELGDFEQDLLVKYGIDISVTVYSTMHVVKQINDFSFDVIILDRDDKEGVSFHDLDWDKISTDKVIATSTIPEWNQMLERKGTTHMVRKDFLALDEWAKEVVQHVIDITRKA